MWSSEEKITTVSASMRVRVRTNFAQNTKTVTHEQTIELDAPVIPAKRKDGSSCLAVEMEDGRLELWDSLYGRIMREAREVAATELEARRKRFLTNLET